MTNKYNFTKKEYGIWGYPPVFDFDHLENEDVYKENYMNYDLSGFIKLYIHIPFCVTRCAFCPFYKERYSSMEPDQIDDFFHMLWKEIHIYADMLKNKKLPVFSVYFGGGDPACVDVAYIEKTIELLQESFDLSQCEEIILEGNAKSLLDMDKLYHFRSADVNRISFGVQTFDPTIRRKLALRPSIDDIYQTIENLQKVPFERFDIDMMYNLPDQTEESLLKDLKIAFQLPTTYVSYYQLTVMPNTQFEALLKKQSYTKSPPSSYKDMEFSQFIMETAKAMNVYEPRYMCFSSKEDSRKDDDLDKICFPVLAFGPSAKGTFFNINYKNISSVKEYTDMLKNDHLPATTCYLASEDDQDEYRVMMALMLMCFRKSEIANNARFHTIISDLISSGYMIEQNGQLSLTDQGKIFIGNIQYLFINERQKNRRFKNVLQSRLRKVNPYNQDKMDIK